MRINNEIELVEIAKNLFSKIDEKTVVLLNGCLGAGKTTLIKYISEQFDVDKNEVASPTYLGASIYNGRNGANLCHIDLYRYSTEVSCKIVQEYLEDDYLPMFIEWPSNLTDNMIESIGERFNIIDINIELKDDETRIITINELSN